MAFIETYCKLYASSDSKLKYQINQQTLHTKDDVFKFTNMFPQTSINSDINAVLYPEIKSYDFLNGFNNSLLVCSTPSLFQYFAYPKSSRKQDMLFAFLFEQLQHQWGKKLKAKKKLAASSKINDIHDDTLGVQFRNFAISEKLTDTKSTSTMGIRQVQGSQLSHKTGHTAKNENNLIDVMSLNVKDFIQTIQNNVSFEQEDMINVIEFKCCQSSMKCNTQSNSFNRIIFLPSNNGEEILNLNQILSPHNHQSSKENYFSDIIGGKCYTKVLCLIGDGIEINTTQLLHSCMKLKVVCNYPVENTTNLQLVNQFHDHIALLQNDNLKTENIHQARSIEYEERLQSITEENSRLNEENSRLKDQVESLTEELKAARESCMKIVALQKDIDQKNAVNTKEKLEMTNEAITFKLQSNQLQLDLQKHQHDSKDMLSQVQDQVLKLKRSIIYERKLNEDMKEKHEALQQDNHDLTEEYTTLKVNYETLKHQYQQQMKSQDVLKNGIQTIEQQKERITQDKNMEITLQIKECIEEIENMNAKASMTSYRVDEKSKSTDNLDALRNILHKELHALNCSINKLKSIQKDDSTSSCQLKEKNASLTTEVNILTSNKDIVDHQVIHLQQLLQQLSTEYKLRLEKYITDIKIFFSNNNQSNEKDQLENLFATFKENYTKDSSVKDQEIDNLKEHLKKFTRKHKQFVITFRLHMLKCTGEDRYIEDEDEIVASEYQQDEFMKREEHELKLKLKRYENLTATLQQELNDYKTMTKNGITKLDTSDWSVIQKKMNQLDSNTQSILEKQKAELLTRCLLAEEQLSACQRQLQDINAKWSFEVDDLCHQLKRYEDMSHGYPSTNHMQAIEGVNETKYEQGFLPPINQRSRSFPHYQPR